jgi:hypothetical protein
MQRADGWEMRGPPVGAGVPFQADGWPSAAQNMGSPVQDRNPGFTLDGRRDTGRGWSILPSSAQADPSQSYIRMEAVHPPRSAVIYHLLYMMTRSAFNFLLIGIILTILAIPTALGLARLGALVQQTNTHVPTPTPRPIPTPSSGYSTYRAAAYNVAYPMDWSRATSNHVIQFTEGVQEVDFRGPTQSLLAIGTRAVIPQDQLLSLLDATPSAYAQGRATNFLSVFTPRPGPTLDGALWDWEQFTFHLNDGHSATAMQAEVLATNHGLDTYIIIYQAPVAQFADVETQHFKPMLASFRFGS